MNLSLLRYLFLLILFFFIINNLFFFFFKKKNDLNLKLSSNLIDYISFPLSNQNKKSTLMSSSLIYAKNKKLYFHPITNHSNNLVKESDNTLSSDKPCVISFSQDIEVMAVNSMNGLIAVGLENGEIVVLHHVDQFLSHFFHEREIKESLLTKTTLQWHAHSGKIIIYRYIIYFFPFNITNLIISIF